MLWISWRKELVIWQNKNIVATRSTYLKIKMYTYMHGRQTHIYVNHLHLCTLDIKVVQVCHTLTAETARAAQYG